MSQQYWLGPTYEFRSKEWTLKAGIPAEEGRLEWLLGRTENGEETLSHSFVLDPGAGREDLEAALAELPSAVQSDLVAQVAAQMDPRLLANGQEEGLA